MCDESHLAKGKREHSFVMFILSEGFFLFRNTTLLHIQKHYFKHLLIVFKIVISESLTKIKIFVFQIVPTELALMGLPVQQITCL